MKTRRLVPNIVEDFFLNKIQFKEFEGAVLFLDISGFTSTTEELMKNGKEGAEVLSKIINDVFTPAISAVERHSGFVPVFAGDAFYAVFPAGKKINKSSTVSALLAAGEIVREFTGLNPVKTRFGGFVFSPKIALSSGKIIFKTVDCGRRYMYYFKGKPFDVTAELQKKCGDNEVLADIKIKKVVKTDKRFKFIKKTENFFSANIRLKKNKELKNQPKKFSIRIAEKFIPKSVLSKKETGEFRDTVACFISLERVKDIDQAIKNAVVISDKFGGYMNKIIAGDKGVVALTIFGAPTAVEKPLEKAVRFSLELNSVSKRSVKTGISRGVTYSGFVGSPDMSEYTVMGKSVNLAARLMVKGKKGQILIDERTAQALTDRFILKPEGKRKFKGIKERMDVFSVEEVGKDEITGNLDDLFVGREKEKNQIIDVLKKTLKEKVNGGMIFIDGEPGMGKTRLVSEVLNEEEIKDSFTIVFLSFEPSQSESLSPFVKFLKNYFFSAKNDFDAVLSELAEKTGDRVLREELLRGRDFLAYFAGVEKDLINYPGIKPEKISENFFYAFKAMIKALSSFKPVILTVDDFQWVDEDSIDLMRVLSINVEKFPYVFLATCRLKDDGQIFDPETEFPVVKRILIEHFGAELTGKMLKNTWKSEKLPQKTIEFFHEKTGGNPFFIEQFALYFMENKLLSPDFSIAGQTDGIPSDINSVITARFDRLTDDLKEAIKNASVLGKEFAVDVLSRMLRNKRIYRDLRSGEDEQIWTRIEKIRYMFRHVLIRDSVYQMILKKKLRSLHNLAGSIIEEIYAEDISSHYVELIEHWDRAENADRVIKTGRDAVKHAAEKGMKKDSLTCYETMDRYLTGSEKTANKIQWAQTLYNTSNFKKAIAVAEEALIEAEKDHDKKSHCRSVNLIFEVTLHVGDREEIRRKFDALKELLENTDDPVSLINTLDNIAMYHHHSGYEEQGYVYAKRALEEAEKLADSSDNRQYLNILAKNYSITSVFFGREVGLDRVFEYLDRALKIAERIESKPAKAVLYSNLGLSYMEIKLDANKAMFNFKKALELYEEFQDRNGSVTTLNNMALIALHKKELKQAEELFRRAHSISIEIGDIPVQILCLINLCSVERNRGRYDKALELLDEAIEKVNKCGKDLFLAEHYDIRFGINVLKKEYEEAEKSNEALLAMHGKLKNDYLLFRYEINSAELVYERGDAENAEKKLNQMLEKWENTIQKAEIFYLMWKIKRTSESRQRAADLYKKLIEEETGEYKQLSYIDKYEELTS